MSHDRIEPAAYRPPGRPRPPAPRWLRPLPWLLLAVLLLFGTAAWFVFTARAVTIEIQPAPASMAVRGGLSLALGPRHLLRPGHYTVVATKPGYRRLERGLRVTAGGDTEFRFEMQKLPGRLQVRSQPEGARVHVDGETVGRTPLHALELAPGVHEIELQAPRHKSVTRRVRIRGGNELQRLEIQLEPDWAPVRVTSEPAGATLLVDGEPLGTTPVTAEIGSGAHTLALRLDGYQEWQHRIEVTAGQSTTLDKVTLDPAPARLALASDPDGALVQVGDAYRGRTPVTLTLAPGQRHAVRLRKPGYRSAERSVRIASGAEQRLTVSLTPILGSVALQVQPTDAAVYVDGERRGSGSQSLRLTAREHEITVRKPGYETFETTVLPDPDRARQLEVRLRTKAQARLAALPDRIRSPAGGPLVLVAPGRFTMGSPRRAQGARANEVRREVRLTRPFYLGVHEVTNADFRQFRAQHSSGIVARETLDNDAQPVVRVTWADAVAYCNWLSDRAGLAPAYRNGQLVTPVTTGYRLPTEAEWAWAARFADGRSLVYPWGDAMPPTGAAGNYAGRSAAPLVEASLQTYDDGYAATAPVGSFPANALGLFDIGGNVAEWTHDAYSATPGTGLEVDPLGPSVGSAHVVRGSSWRDGRITPLRLAYRRAVTGGRDDVGFRVARYADLPPAP